MPSKPAVGRMRTWHSPPPSDCYPALTRREAVLKAGFLQAVELVFQSHSCVAPTMATGDPAWAKRWGAN